MTLEEPVQKALNNLYTYNLVQKDSGRAVYEKILVENPFCPYCTFGESRTLDHYLPKSKFPEFSINPLNLVPACSKCNTRKSSKVILDKNKQYIHPYFDNIDFQWLNSKITICNKTPMIEYSVKEEVLNDTLGSRISHHFYSFKINESCERRANARLNRLHVKFIENKEALKAHLTYQAQLLPPNDWEKSFCECLVASEEFWTLEWEI